MNRRRGYALIFAMILVGFTAIVFTATTSMLKTDAMRTGAEVRQAQLRQLLIAGQSSAAEELQRTGTLKDHALALPSELPDARLSLANVKVTSDRVEATVTASFIGQTLEQSLVYEKRAGQWRLMSAALP